LRLRLRRKTKDKSKKIKVLQPLCPHPELVKGCGKTEARNDEHETRNSKLETRNAKLETRNDKRYTMNTLSKLLLLLFILPASLSCHHNPLKTDEKALAKEIKLKEAEKLASETKTSKNHNDLRVSFTKKEIRSADKKIPPIIIDILDNPFSTKELKLSAVASSIRYVKLQTPPDTSLTYDPFYYRPDIDSYIRSDDHQLIFQGIFGVTKFSMNGEYLETIWKNNSGIKFYGKKMVAYGGADFFGVLPYIPVSLSDGYLYSNFLDGPEKRSLVMRHKLNSEKSVTSPDNSDIQKFNHFPGDTVLLLKKDWYQGFEKIQALSPDSWAGINSKWTAGSSGVLLVTFNLHGDTLCKFSDYDRIVNFTSALTRIAIGLTSYSFNGLLTIKQEYNDTVFRLIPPDRLLPVYIIRFGAAGISYMEGLNADIDLSGKYMLNSLRETNDFLFIRYTQNHDGLNNRNKGKVKFYNALFDKKEKKLYHQPGFTLLPTGLNNDLDGGISFWPDFVSPQGEMMKLLSGQVLKDYVNSEQFKKSSISEENRKKQISLVSGLKPTDMVVIIVK
jgi:hypothetical protein